MPTLLQRRKATQRRALANQRKRVRNRNLLNKAIARARGRIAARRRLIQSAGGGNGARAVKFLTDRAGWTEVGNRAPWLDAWARKYVGEWMVAQPWCGLACIAAWDAAGKRLPSGTVYTPNLVAWANSGSNFTRVAASSARPGDLVVFNFPGGSGVADHVGLARGPARNGVIPTVEGNTSPTNGSSQSNGGGIYIRSRPLSLVAVVARPK